MIESLRQFMNFFRYLGLIFANKSNLSRPKQSLLLKNYLFLVALNLCPSFLKNKIKQVSFFGHQLSFFDLQTTTSLIESIFIENEYFFQAASKKPHILDLGSNIGLSVIYFKNLYPHCSLDAFEPDPTTCALLSQNVRTFHFRQVTVNNLAVSAKNGLLDFYIARDGAGSPLMSTDPLRLSPAQTIKVKSLKLSAIIKEKIDFLKMDIEGSESAVLTNLDRSGKIKFIDQMSLEYHHHIDSQKDNLSGFLKILEKNHFGYQIHASQNTPFTLKTFEDIQIHAYRKA